MRPRSKLKSLGLLPRVEARKRKDGGFSYRFQHDNGTRPTIARDPIGRPGAAVLEANRKALDIAQGRGTAGSLEHLIAEYMASTYFKQLAPRTQKNYEAYARVLAKPFGAMAPNSILPRHIAHYLRQYRKDAPVVANKEIKFLSTVFQYGIEVHDLKINPTRDVRRNKEQPRVVLPEAAQVRALLDLGRSMGRASHMAVLIATMVALTGFRRQDVLHMTRFNLRDEGVSAVESKAKPGEARRTRLVSWTDSMREIVNEALALPRPTSTQFVFCTQDGTPYTDDGFKSIMGRLMTKFRAAGGQRFTTHDLRAYFVTTKRERGENPETHASVTTMERVYDRRKVKTTKGIDL